MSEWISVNDRLPSIGDGKGRDCSVLCYLSDRPNDFSFAGACTVSVYNVEGWVDEGKCSHWMPLPEPPKD